MNDASVLDWLDQLLALDEEQRAARLLQLSTQEPALHARVLKLLGTALTVASSRFLEGAMQRGVGAMTSSFEAPLHIDQSIAGYRLLRELGRGGMAAVWLAERVDGHIKRPVAIKLPLFSVGSPVAVARFLQEKDVLAGLTHPHIARLYDAGIEAGRPFIVLEYIDGIPITDYCDRNRLDLPSRLRLFLQVLEAVDHAHQRLIVHRDLKPSNILVDTQGQVKLLDFGISKLLCDPIASSQAVELTQVGDTVLTPAYAAPEQADGSGVSTLTDVFVLGVVLHELLSGTLPYAGVCGSTPTLASMIDALLRSSPTRPSQAQISESQAHVRAASSAARLRTMLKGDLDTITYKALQYEPAHRYTSVERFADDLRRFLCSLPIAARRSRATYSLRLFLKRNRSVSVAVCMGAIFSLVGATTAVQQYLEARASAERAAAVRDFMFEFVNDSEPTESQAADQITGRQLLDSAVIRARQISQNKAELRGELLGELGRMYLRFEQPDTARQIMSEAIEILQAVSASDNPALNHTRAQLSSILFTENNVAQARALATVARNACQRRSPDCAKARYIANGVLADLDRLDGQVEQSLRASRQAVVDATAAFGADHYETAIALGKLALMLRNAGQLIEAGKVAALAQRRASRQTLRKIERIRLSRTLALIDMDLGKYAVAFTHLTQLLARTDSPNERALQLRLLANVHVAMGEPARALEVADAAIALIGREHTGVEVLYARQARAQALALLGHATAAQADIEQVLEGLLRAGRSPLSPEVLRARRIRGEILLRNGHPTQSLHELTALRTQLLALAEPRPLELGQTLDLLGCAQRELHLLMQGVGSHEAATVQFEKILPADHPLLARNTLYKLVAADERQRFLQQAAHIKFASVAGSVWRQTLDGEANHAMCRADQTAACKFVL